MNNFIIYSAEITISMALFYTAYWLFLKNETFFKLNRYYLLSSVLVALIAPLLNISIVTNTGEDSFITRYLVVPIERYEQRIMGGINNETIRTGDRKIISDQEKAEKPGAASQAQASNDLVQINILNSAGSGSSGKLTNWLSVAFLIYLIGAALLLIRFAVNLILILVYASRYHAQEILGMKVVRLDKNISPFSFLHLIFINNKTYTDPELSKIISHERVHIRQKHAMDLILFELLLVFQWFNPFIWLYKRAIKLTHEYLADQGTLNSGVDLPGYQYSLLNQALSDKNFEITNSYNLSVKKRIVMMLKKRSSRLSVLKLAVALPILVFLLGAFAFSPEDQLSQTGANAGADSSIKKVSVPIEYLKLLEGEYVSTNEPGRVRRIIFTEMLGTLFGCDNGYTYRIIPVGGEKFINPDDKAPLEFSSKNKNDISLLLFGKIILKKEKPFSETGNIPNRSLAFSLANVVIQQGTSVAVKRFKEMKDSSNYYFTEYDMNYAGYHLLEAGKAKEAVVILKLAIETFSASFNTYDSYGEALLALGDKTRAIEAFKKSVELNPGSRNGIKRLKELGINPDDVIKLVKPEPDYLKLLEGDYLSTDQPNWVRWIRFTVEEGALTGTDNGYHYQLIQVGDEKFINPDDGESLVFDTRDKTAISLLLFGRIHLKKVKTFKEPASDFFLMQYAGLYVPSKKDDLKNMDLRVEHNKLYRVIESESTPNGKVELKFVTDNTAFYTDNSGRSLEFIVNDKKQVTGCVLRRPDGVFRLTKQK